MAFLLLHNYTDFIAKLNIDNQSYISLVVIILFIIGLIIGIKLRKSK